MANAARAQEQFPSFTASRYELGIMRKIADRAWAIDWLRSSYRQFSDLLMDIEAVHCNGNQLRLDELLAADEFNFGHDMSGICNCLDRSTGKLTRGFSPRFSLRAS